jgi:hypothetical protein
VGDIADKNFTIQLYSWIIDLFSFANENSLEIRKYHFKICEGKMCHYTSLFLCCCYIQCLKDKIENYLTIPKKDPRMFLKENKILLFSSTLISNWNQMQLYQQLLLLSQRWFHLLFDPLLFETLQCIFSRFSFLVVFPQDESIMNGKLDKDKKKLGNEDKYALSIEFIDTISCMFQDFMNTLVIYNVIKKKMIKVDSDLFFEQESWGLEKVESNIMKWVEQESSMIGDDRFKQRLREFCIKQSLYCGELNIVIRDSGGILPSNGSSVIEKSRTPNQVSWWSTHSIQKTLGIKLNPKLPIIRDTTIIFIFDSYCRSNCKFDWADTVLLDEKRFLIKIEDCLLYDSPLLFQIMKDYYVFYKKKWYDSQNIESAIFMWLYFVKENDYIFKTLNGTWNLEPLHNLYKIFSKESLPVIQQWEEEKIQNQKIQRGIYMIPI